MERNFCSLFHFVLEAISRGYESLPQYKMEPPQCKALSPAGFDGRKSETQEKLSKPYYSQQGVKRTCGHAQESVRKKN